MRKAEDTVIKEGTIVKNQRVVFQDHNLLEEQAEQSFKAGFNEALNTVVATKEYDEGKEAGMREVAEWIRKANHLRRVAFEQGRLEGRKEVVKWIEDRYSRGYLSFCGLYLDWQNQKKEWGIDEKNTTAEA